jgi:hypothetical protein
MIPERHSLQPLITQLRCTKEKVFLIGRDRLNEKEVKNPGREATLLSMKLIVANARIITPSFCRPPEECSRGINLRQLAVSWPRAKRLTSPMLSPTPGWVLDAPFCLVALLLSPPGPGERSADPASPANPGAGAPPTNSGQLAQLLPSCFAPQLVLALYSLIPAQVLRLILHPPPSRHQLAAVQQQLPQIPHLT